MGILNITPDSFFQGSRYAETESAIDKIGQMIEDGIDILDIGAFTSRPGAVMIDEDMEWSRLEPILKILLEKFPDLPLSLDTYRSEIAKRSVLEFGVSIINDISAGLFDSKMPETIGKLKVPIVLMHMQGDPKNMQQNPHYDNVVFEVLKFLNERVGVFKEAGAHDIILDPGFGFGKTMEHNYQIINQLELFKTLDNLLLVGLSRKSMIYKSLGVEAENALNGTTAINAICRFKGADILRVHDVKEAVECLKLTNQVMEPELLS